MTDISIISFNHSTKTIGYRVYSNQMHHMTLTEAINLRDELSRAILFLGGNINDRSADKGSSADSPEVTGDGG